MFNSHTSETSLLYLQGHQSSEVEADFSFFCWMDTGISGGSKNVEALVSDLIDHF